MTKLVAVIRRRPDMTREECHRYWREVHAEIAKGMPGVRRYVINLATRGAAAGEEPPFDGVAELWFDDVAASEAAFASEAGRKTIEDLVNFTDNRPQIAVADEHVMVGP